MDQSNKRHNTISASLKGAPKIAMRCDNKDDIPEGAVFITEDQALEAQYNLLQHWHPKEEIWPFLHGKKLLAGVTGMTGIVLNGQIRAFYQLSHQKIFLTLAPAVLVPYLFTQIYHAHKISSNVLLGNIGCPACLCTKSGVGQAALSTFSPLVLASICGYAVVNIERTRSLPMPWDYRGLGKLGLQLLKANRNLLLGSLGLNFAFAYWLTHKEMKAHIIMQLRIKHQNDMSRATQNTDLNKAIQ